MTGHDLNGQEYIRSSARCRLHRARKQEAELKAAELVEGESYALELPGRDECLRAELLGPGAKPGHVKVRVEVSAEEFVELEVLNKRISSSWRRYRTDSLQLVDTDAFDEVTWIPNVGDEVERTEVFGRWRVKTIQAIGDGWWASLEGTLFSVPQQELVSLIRLIPLPPRRTPSAGELDSWLGSYGLAPIRLGESAEEHRAAVAARRQDPDMSPKDLADALTFGEKARLQYRILEPRCRRGDEAKRMARELRGWGRIRRVRADQPGHWRGEVIRHSVPGRFEVVFFEDPKKVEGELLVERIEILPKRKPKPARRRNARKGRTRRGPQGERRRRRPRGTK